MKTVTINGAVSAFTKQEFDRIVSWMNSVAEEFFDDCGEFERTAISESAMIQFDIDPFSEKGQDMWEIAFHVGEVNGWD